MPSINKSSFIQKEPPFLQSHVIRTRQNPSSAAASSNIGVKQHLQSPANPSNKLNIFAVKDQPLTKLPTANMGASGQEIYVTVSLSILSFLIVVSNVAVCAMVCFTKTLRTYTNWLIVSLAVSDILTGGILLPTLLIKPTSVVTDYLISITLLSGVANICAVTYDRYVAIIKPMHYKYLVPKLFKRAIVVSWLFPTIYSLLPLIWDTERTLTINVVYIVGLEALGVIVPYIFITFAYVRIFRHVRRSLRMRREFKAAREQRNERRRISSDAQVVKVFGIISTAFLFSWLPILYTTTVIGVLNLLELVPYSLRTISLFAIATNSLVDPLVYAFLKPDFKAIIQNFCRKSSAVVPVPTKPSVLTPSRQVGAEENMKQREQRAAAKTENNSAKEADTYF